MITQVTITSSIVDPHHVMANGELDVVLSEPVSNGAVYVDTAPITAIITGGSVTDTQGAPFTIAALDDMGTTPTGTVYEWTLRCVGAPPITVSRTVGHAEGPLDIVTIFTE